jgi:hypothetical protein
LSKILEIFSNREISTFFWVIVLIVWALSKKKIRKSVSSTIKVFFKLLKWYLIMIVYIAAFVLIFHIIEIWDISLLKDTIYWVFGGAFIIFFNVDKALRNEKFFINTIKDCFKLIILIEFLSNLYSFHISIELISIPIIFLLGLLSIDYESIKIDKNVKKFTNVLITIYVLAVITFSLIKAINNLDNVFTIGNFQSLLLGSVMTLLFIPLLYVISLYMAYEGFLKMKKFILKDQLDKYQFLKKQVLKRCNISLKKIVLVNNKLHIYNTIEKENMSKELDSILNNQ